MSLQARECRPIPISEFVMQLSIYGMFTCLPIFAAVSRSWMYFLFHIIATCLPRSTKFYVLVMQLGPSSLSRCFSLTATEVSLVSYCTISFRLLMPRIL
jgi:hypothetical protein